MSKAPNSPGRLGGPAAREILEKEKFALLASNSHAPGMGLAPAQPTLRERFMAELRAEAAAANAADPTGRRREIFAAAGMTMPLKKGGRSKRRRSHKKRKTRRS